MKLNEIANFNGSGWAYGKMSRYACEYGGPEKFVNVVHWNGYESGYQSGHLSGYQGGQASMVLPMIGLSVGTAIIGAGAALLIKTLLQKKENPNSKEKKSVVSAKSHSKRLI